MILGGGRETKESVIDLSVGLILHKKVGDEVKCGEVLATIHYNDEAKADACEQRFRSAYHIAKDKPEAHPFIYDILT